MHEGNFTEQIVEAILSGLKGYSEKKPERIRVKVGEMLHLEEESVRLHYEVLTKDTVLEGVQLDLQPIPVTIRCNVCKTESEAEDHHLLICPKCHSFEVQVTGGDRIEIEAIE
jgi:hydrogenase nickel incorporation protein HypA/HybF